MLNFEIKKKQKKGFNMKIIIFILDTLLSIDYFSINSKNIFNVCICQLLFKSCVHIKIPKKILSVHLHSRLIIGALSYDLQFEKRCSIFCSMYRRGFHYLIPRTEAIYVQRFISKFDVWLQKSKLSVNVPASLVVHCEVFKFMH